MKGRVKFYNTNKRFGFIEGEDGKEYFVHESGVAEGFTPNAEDQVSFDVEEGDRGPKASNVALAGGSSEPAESTESEETEASEEPEESEESEKSEEPEATE